MQWSSRNIPLKSTTAEKPASNVLPAKRITPLYKEVLNVLIHSNNGLSMVELAKRVKTTKHFSRLRMALDALRELELVDESMDVTPKYKVSEIRAIRALKESY